MAEMKECFGQCGGVSIRCRDLVKEHYVHTDPQKMKECDPCPLFTQCMFLRYNGSCACSTIRGVTLAPA